MNSKRLNVIFAALLASPAVAPAQSIGSSSSHTVANPTPGIYEDAEIMRRVLARTVQALDSERALGGAQEDQNTAVRGEVPAGMVAVPTLGLVPSGTVIATGYTLRPAPGQLGAVQVQGGYLRGYGVVYTLALPHVFWPNQVVAAAAAKATVAAPNLWEQIRSELRGEASPTPVPVRTEVPRMDEILLRALFDNGGNFSQLRDHENLAVIVTFGPTLPARVLSSPAAQATPAGAPAQVGLLAFVAADAKNNELLGDLHLKQGRPEEAVKAYRNAVERGSASANLLTKLAQAYLAAHDLEAARKTIEEATRAGKEQVHQLPVRRQNAELVPLPGTMTISVSLETLAQLRAGKLDFDGFRKQVTVDYASPSGSN